MTKLLPLTLLCCVLSLSILNAQSPGKLIISSGIGIAPTYHGSTASTDMPAVSLQVGYEVSKKFSLSAYAGYTAASSNQKLLSDGLLSKVENKTTAFGLRGEFRKDMTDRLEVYGGMVLGYKAFNITEFDVRTGEAVERDPDAPTPYNPNAPKGQAFYSGFVGTKYFFKKNIGLFGEFGYGLSLVNLGATFKL